jgi:hypothetical protein
MNLLKGHLCLRVFLVPAKGTQCLVSMRAGGRDLREKVMRPCKSLPYTGNRRPASLFSKWLDILFKTCSFETPALRF